MAPSTTSREFFEQLYQKHPDPWGFADDAYERDRYRRILEQVPSGRWATAFEPGCSIGVLTRELSFRCDRVIALDIADAAVDATRRRCADRPGVEVVRGDLPSCLPVDLVDLVVLSEVGYYLHRNALTDLVRHLRALLRPGGRVVAAHWIGVSADHVLHGLAVHHVLERHIDLPHRHRAVHRHPSRDAVERAFILDVWDLPA